ncbi:hypothetical protein [Solibacillus sp. CAU 1738]|uniref:hypothetical protein n=1 Tax=Solibacillus sp. CAU 1738 TaxID=3140363 RepID=UPI0032603CA3
MLHLLRLEFTKMKRSRFTYVLLFVLFVSLCIYFFYIDRKETKLEEAEAYIITNLESHLEWYESAKKELDEKDGKADRILQNNLNASERQYNAFKMMHEGFTNKNWSLYWQGEILNNSFWEETKKKELEFVAKSYTYPTPFTIFSGMDQMRWMEERSIQPIFPTGSLTWLSLYDEEFSEPIAKEIALKYSQKYSTSGIHFIYHLFSYGFGFIGLMFFLFLFSDILTKEGFGRNGPIQMLRTVPIRRSTFWFSKAFTVIGGSFLVICCITIVGVTLGTIFNRFGDWDYPILIYGPDRTYSFLPIAEFLGKSLLLFLLVLAFSFTLLFLFSILTNRAILTIGLTVIAIIIGQTLTDQASLLSWVHWLPFHYIEVYPILSGEYAITTDNPIFTYQQAILSLSLSTLILLLITFSAVKLRKGVMS